MYKCWKLCYVGSSSDQLRRTCHRHLFATPHITLVAWNQPWWEHAGKQEMTQISAVYLGERVTNYIPAHHWWEAGESLSATFLRLTPHRGSYSHYPGPTLHSSGGVNGEQRSGVPSPSFGGVRSCRENTSPLPWDELCPARWRPAALEGRSHPCLGQSLSRGRLFATLRTVAPLAPLSTEFP